jgi:hypothetical protein
MRKLMINNVPYVWRSLSYQHPDGNSGGEIIIAFPENEPDATPLFLIDNNGTDPFASFGYANWMPAFGVHFRDLKEGEPVSWTERDDAIPFGLTVLFHEINEDKTKTPAEKMYELGSRIMQEILGSPAPWSPAD